MILSDSQGHSHHSPIEILLQNQFIYSKNERKKTLTVRIFIYLYGNSMYHISMDLQVKGHYVEQYWSTSGFGFHPTYNMLDIKLHIETLFPLTLLNHLKRSS